jgi:hypothetical protein
MGEKRELQRAKREHIARLIYPYYTAAGPVPWKHIKNQTGISYGEKYCMRCLAEFQNVLIQEDVEKRIEAGHTARWEARYGFPYPGPSKDPPEDKT